MKYEVAMIYKSSFTETAIGIQNSTVRIHRQHSDHISLLLFSQKGESTPKTKECDTICSSWATFPW
jgi:hypothetical protein